ncbi:hypothetical protein BJ508DRAFT_409965 [Ascobolus immersus RN42]|uniref:Rrn9 domain-containing protein n=1 Tax=Ascobolus immersus RN42 TaxID=1160509 RepID=A0A3N4J2E1_ASCIM|nr:hypothetical protein BJ508DRAFT_409965 [Ascobolus immersus RN42]
MNTSQPGSQYTLSQRQHRHRSRSRSRSRTHSRHVSPEAPQKKRKVTKNQYQEERALLHEVIEEPFSRDLAGHLMSAFMAKRELAERQAQRKERLKRGAPLPEDVEDSGRSYINNAWTAWPVPMEEVPKLRDLGERFMDDPEGEGRPSAVLERCLVAGFAKVAKERIWERRETEGFLEDNWIVVRPRKPSTPEPESEPEHEAEAADGPDGERVGAEDKEQEEEESSRKRKSRKSRHAKDWEATRDEITYDDDVVRKIVGTGAVGQVMDAFEGLLDGLEVQRQSYWRDWSEATIAAKVMEKMSRQDKSGVLLTARKTARKRKIAELDVTAKNSKMLNEKLKLRDWKVLLGMAKVKGWGKGLVGSGQEERILEKTQKRCEELFGQKMEMPKLEVEKKLDDGEVDPLDDGNFLEKLKPTKGKQRSSCRSDSRRKRFFEGHYTQKG